MAATKRNAMLIEEARGKIQTTQLINRLQKHVDGKVDMSATQVQAARVLLGKSLPDLQAIAGSINFGLHVAFVLQNGPAIGEIIDASPLQITGD